MRIKISAPMTKDKVFCQCCVSSTYHIINNKVSLNKKVKQKYKPTNLQFSLAKIVDHFMSSDFIKTHIFKFNIDN